MVSAGSALALDWGLGIQAGEPTGLSSKFWLTEVNAIDAIAAWSFNGDGAFTIQGDYLYHKYDWITVAKGTMAVYFGAGARLTLESTNRFGVRIPIGIDYMIAGAPLDVYGEIAPVLDLAPSTEFNFNGAIGIRYYFGGTFWNDK